MVLAGGASAFALRFVYEPYVAPQRVAACQPFATAADVVIGSDACHVSLETRTLEL